MGIPIAVLLEAPFRLGNCIWLVLGVEGAIAPNPPLPLVPVPLTIPGDCKVKPETIGLEAADEFSVPNCAISTEEENNRITDKKKQDFLCIQKTPQPVC